VDRPFLTRREVNRRLVLLAAAVVFAEFELSALNNVMHGTAMALVWSASGLAVGIAVAIIERFKGRRGE